MENVKPINIFTGILPLNVNPSIPANLIRYPDSYPAAPLVTAFTTSSSLNTVVLRITVFIDSDYTIFNPKGPELIPKGVVDTIATFNVEYLLKEKNPFSYTAWYFDIVFASESVISAVEVFTVNNDPKTSRGTKTVVQSVLVNP